MPDSMFDIFAGSRRDRHPPLTVIGEDGEPVGSPDPEAPAREATAQAKLFAVAALAAAGAFAVVGLTTVVIAIAVPTHWMVALLFTGAFVLVAIATGLAAVWHLRGRPEVRLSRPPRPASRAGDGPATRRSAGPRRRGSG